MLPLLPVPQNILVAILRKTDDLSWFRLRKTGTYLHDFVDSSQNSFPIRYSDRRIEIVYMQNGLKSITSFYMDYCKKKMIRVNISLPNGETVEVEQPEFTLYGVSFQEITMRGFHFIISDEDRPKILDEFKKFTKRMPLHCDVFSCRDKLEHLPLYLPMIATVKSVSVHIQRGEGAKLLETVADPSFERIKGLFVSGKRFSPLILPLTKKFEVLKITDHPDDFSETVDTLQTLFQFIRVGEFSGNEPKWLKYNYNWRGGENIEDCEELRGLEKEVIWKGRKRVFEEEERKEDVVNTLGFLLESPSSTTATVVFIIANVFGLLKATVYVDIREEKKAEEERAEIFERIYEDMKKDREEYWERVKEEEAESRMNESRRRRRRRMPRFFFYWLCL